MLFVVHLLILVVYLYLGLYSPCAMWRVRHYPDVNCISRELFFSTFNLSKTAFDMKLFQTYKKNVVIKRLLKHALIMKPRRTEPNLERQKLA